MNINDLKAEIARKNLSIPKLAELINVDKKTLYSRMNGEKSFKQLLASLFKIIPPGSGIVFCYPDRQFFTDTDCISTAFLRRRQKKLLSGASYSEVQMEKLLSDHGFRLYEHLNPRQVHRQFFSDREIINRRKLAVCDHINYCLAVKK